jgi:hypothetical protein
MRSRPPGESQSGSLGDVALKILSVLLACSALTLAAGPVPARAATRTNAAPFPSCDRACLVGIVEQYVRAFVARDPARAPWAEHVMASENNVEMRIGDGAWGVITGKGPQDLTLADPQTGQAAYYGVIQLNGIPCWYAVRIKVADRRITEVEALWRPRGAVLRPDAPAGNDPMALQHDPEFFLSLKPEERTARRRMVDLAEGYFSTLQLNDGKILTAFTDDCSRNDNGTVTAGLPDAEHPKRQTCVEDFKGGHFWFDNAARERDMLLVDEEKGLVLARAFLDHDAKPPSGPLPDGTMPRAAPRTPNSFSMLELFKIKKGAIHRIYVVHVDVPYRSTSPWTGARSEP